MSTNNPNNMTAKFNSPQPEGPVTQITPGTVGIMIVSALLIIFVLFVAPFIGWGI